MTGMYNDIILNTLTVDKDTIIKSSSKTNKVKFNTVGDFNLTEFKLFNFYFITTWDELNNLTWEEAKVIPLDELQKLHGGVI